MRGPMRHPLPPGYSGPVPNQPEDNEPENTGDEEPGLDDTLPLDMSEPIAQPKIQQGPQPVSKIRTFEQKLSSGKHEDTWNRTPNVTGTGAIHVKSFHCKLTGDSLDFLDQQINEWLDAHPQYEVKLVTTAIGTWTGKLKEPNLIVNVWV